MILYYYLLDLTVQYRVIVIIYSSILMCADKISLCDTIKCYFVTEKCLKARQQKTDDHL